MKQLSTTDFDALIKVSTIKPRYKRELKFVRSTEKMTEQSWLETELLPIWNKAEQGGIALIQTTGDLFIVPFDASRSSASSTGRLKPVICDFCFTWRSSGQGRLVTFYPYKNDDSISYLCCADLRCSDNVRSKTDAALKSRTQLREDISMEGRIKRLQTKLDAFVERIS